MNICHTIHGWLNGLYKNSADGNLQPAFLPLTREEVEEVKHNAIFFSPYDTFDPGASTKIYGMPLHETCYAVEQRARQLTVPYLHLEESTTIADYMSSLPQHDRAIRRRLHARICAETTTLKVTFEWDRWASVKRFLRITRWFPVSTRTVLIDGRVLYPYLKVGLPHNRHSVQYQIA